MKKALLVVLLAIVGVFVGVGMASADFGQYPELKKADDFVYELLDKYQARCMEFKVGDPVEKDGGKMYPVELSVVMAEPEKIPDLLREMIGFKQPQISLRPSATTISVTAESRPADGKVLVSCTTFVRVFQGGDAEKQPQGLNIDLLSAVFEKAHFEPGVQKKAQVPGLTVWLTNLRIDSDNRAQMTGYTFTMSELFKVWASLLESGKAPSTLLNNLNANTYYGFPVLRFDLTTSDRPGPSGLAALCRTIEAINDAVEVAGTAIMDLRISPAIVTESACEYPMELGFKMMEIDQWEQFKKTMTAYSKDGASIGKIGELAKTDSPERIVNLVVKTGKSTK